MTTWQLQEAKNKLSELIERALSEGPQVITRHGAELVIVLPMDSYKQLIAPEQRLGDFLMNSPLRNSDLVIERDKSANLRVIDL